MLLERIRSGTMKASRPGSRQPPLPGPGEWRPSWRPPQVKVPRCVTPDEIPSPDSNRRVDDQQLAVGGVGADPGDATCTTGCGQFPGGRRVAVGDVGIEHEANTDAALSGPNQSPSI
jgi:hypothetical protein